MTAYRVLVTSAPQRDISGLWTALNATGWEIVDGIKCPNFLQIIEQQDRIDGVILGLETLGVQEAQALRRKGCRYVSRDGVGVDNIDFEATRDAGIIVSKTAGANSIAVAEHTVGMILACTRNIVTSSRILAEGKWTSTYGTDISGLTLGLFGIGHVGRKVARKLALAFDMNIIAYDPADTPEINGFCAQLPSWIQGCFSKSSFQRASSPEEVFSAADVLSLNMELKSPGKPSNAGFLNASAIAQCKRGVFIINTARGELIVEDDLIAALNSGHVAGAGLDVFVREPLAVDSPFRTMPNVVCTSHIASKSLPARINQGTAAIDNLDSMFELGSPLAGNLIGL